MSWAGIASNQCVSLNNLRDAIANNIFIAKTTVPAGTKQITKTEALAYVDIQTAPLAGKASNQLVVKNNLNAAVYTYNRYDLNLTTCVTSNPIPAWSYYNIPYGSYTINNTYIYQIIPATHSTFTFEITGYSPYTCTPVTQYTYQTSDVNPTTCALSNTIQWWSYNNYASGLYYINGPGTLYSLSASTHTNYSNQITSVSIGSCGSSPTIYYYDYYHIDQNTCAYDSSVATAWSYASVSQGYYFRNNDTNNVYYFIPKGTGTQTFEITNFVSTSCTPSPCKVWYFYNSSDPGSPQERFDYIGCDGVARFAMVTVGTSTPVCVKGGTVPPVGSQGDNPYTFNVTCT